MFGLGFLDIAVIVIYFLAVIYIGFRSMKRVKNQEDYFLAGRRFGKLIQTFAAFGQGTSSESAVGVTTTTFVNGAAGTWSALNVLFATPIYWITSPWYRRMRVLTLGDFFEERYGSKKMAGIYAVFQTLLFMLALSLAFNAMSKTIMALTPKTVDQLTAVQLAEHSRAVELGELEAKDYASLTAGQQSRLETLRVENPRKVFSHISQPVLIWGVCIIILLYAVAGGLEAAFITDTLQGFFIIILSLILIPFAFSKIGSLYGGESFIESLQILHQKVPESFFEVFGSPTTIDFTWYYILSLSLLNTVGVMVQANQLTANAAAKDEYTARFGFTAGMYMKRICTLFWGFLALAAILLYSQSVRDPDMVWGHATRDLLGPLNLGLVGLMIACLMAAVMSTADCFMITSSSLLTHNVYRPMFPGRDEKSYVSIGRFLGASTIVGGALLAMTFESMLQQMKIIWEFGIVFSAPFLLGMLWRRANCRASWWSIGITLMAFFILPLLIPAVTPSLKANPYLLKMTQARTIERQYVAREMDVQERQQQIQQWLQQEQAGLNTDPKPQPLAEGQTFTRTYALAKKPIFWTKGISTDENGQFRGNGMLSLELILLDKCGFDLSNNPYALNETLRVLIRVAVPFLLVFLLSYVTRSDDKTMLDRFFVKMKTEVLPNKEEDDKHIALSYANTSRFDHLRMFPKTQLEITKWTKVDIVGFIVSCLIAAGIVLLLTLMVTVGK